jgi:trigger factor
MLALRMKSTVEPLEGNMVKVSVEVDEAEFDKAIDAAFRKIAREVRIPGFRPGKAPRRVLEARLGPGVAREQALRDAIPDYLAEAVRTNKVDIIATPDVSITGGEESGAVSFDATIEVRPQVQVPGYGGLRVELPAVTVSDDDVQSAVDVELRRAAVPTPVERGIRTGDLVTLDLTAERDGEPVAGLNAEDWSYEVGRGWIAEGFDAELEGLEAGSSHAFTLVPKGTEEAADFRLTVKSVQELVLPELTDEWVAENVGDETVDAWRSTVRSVLESRRLDAARRLFVDRATSSLAGLVEDEPPKALIDNEIRHRAEHFATDLARQGIPFERYLEATGQSQDDIVVQLRAGAQEAVKVDLALRAVAEAEAIEVTDDDLDAEYQRIARATNAKPAQVRRAYEREGADENLRARLRTSRALEWLLQHVEVVDEEGREIPRSLLLPDEAGEAPGHDHDHDGHDHGPDGHDHD